ncbi:hypothetical protein IscW_ISCW014207 [Ixodes scapularis]|uniref:Uncharacterized protein n=1 Tax=Ixodes scapularis TaxID=6945 RepID=B7QI49_IXOSC|nr:hypothetical protein IscW_ISCW014207 [Ixodes scapularis]|eukprot:XP_002414856.1 hypothetical protein IscW_ISCW014207 [Ixodes scapularis]
MGINKNKRQHSNTLNLEKHLIDDAQDHLQIHKWVCPVCCGLGASCTLLNERHSK